MLKKEISCKIISDSINPCGNRLTTFIVTFPRIVLAEFNTHRMFSRNAASSRARPFKVILDEVKNDPFIPIKFLGEHTGMQGFEECKDPEGAQRAWLQARDNAVKDALALSALQVTKQIVNRAVEPYLWVQVIVTATEYENFFGLRAHPDAEIHIARLAEVMLEAYNKSKPQLLQPGEWHIPFGDNMDKERVQALVDADASKPSFQDIQIKIATARCARLSYIPFREEDRYNYKADVTMYENLLKNGHLSPFEHCAQSATDMVYSGNFHGFLQYRKMFSNEKRTDPRVIKCEPPENRSSAVKRLRPNETEEENENNTDIEKTLVSESAPKKQMETFNHNDNNIYGIHVDLV